MTPRAELPNAVFHNSLRFRSTYVGLYISMETIVSTSKTYRNVGYTYIVNGMSKRGFNEWF